MTEPVFIGVDIGGTSLRAARFIGHSHILDAKTKTATQPALGREAMLQRVEHAIREVAPHSGERERNSSSERNRSELLLRPVPLSQAQSSIAPAPTDLSQVEAVGIGLPGPCNPFTGVLYNATNIPGWTNLPIQQLMQDRLGVPVFIGNDANLAALGEWKFGTGRGHRDVLYLTVSTGIGGGVILNNKLLLGAHGLATEVGHIMVQPGGPVCGCGQRGCLEALASGPAIARNARDRLARGEGEGSALAELDPADITTARIGQAALNADAFARSLLTEAGEHIGCGLASLLHLFNPSIVVIGGGVSFVGDLLFEPIRAAVRNHTMNDTYWREVPIVPAELGDDAGLVGAGALAMEESRARVLPDR